MMEAMIVAKNVNQQHDIWGTLIAESDNAKSELFTNTGYLLFVDEEHSSTSDFFHLDSTI
jgi:hypothetical protein